MEVIKKVLANVAQSLTDDEKRQARQNIGAGTGEAAFQNIVFTLNASPFNNPTSATCDKSYSDIANRWGFRSELPIARLSWSGSGNQSIYASSFEVDVASAEIRFVFAMYGGLLLELRYESDGTITVLPAYYKFHKNYEEYRVIQNSQGEFSRNFTWAALNETLNWLYMPDKMSRFEYPYILLVYNHYAEPTRADIIFKLDFAKAIMDTSTNDIKGYQFSCIHRANYGTSSEQSVLVTYTIWKDNTDGINAYPL